MIHYIKDYTGESEDIDITIIEAIAKYKEITNTDANCPEHCNIPCDRCVQESKQLVRWLEELSRRRVEELFRKANEKAIRDKAIDDFVDKIISLCDDGEFMNRFNEFTATTILEIAEQLKEII